MHSGSTSKGIQRRKRNHSKNHSHQAPISIDIDIRRFWFALSFLHKDITDSRCPTRFIESGKTQMDHNKHSDHDKSYPWYVFNIETFSREPIQKHFDRFIIDHRPWTLFWHRKAKVCFRKNILRKFLTSTNTSELSHWSPTPHVFTR